MNVNDWIITANSEPSHDWDSFVSGMPSASLYMYSGWPMLVREVFGHQSWFIEARNSGGALRGVLPVVHQKSLLGNFATSLAFFNYGGALSGDEFMDEVMMRRALALAKEAGCSYLEFRDTKPRAGDWEVRTNKVSMVLELPTSEAALSKFLGAKVRSQIKRALREKPEVLIGGVELLDDFYDVFCRGMRDLGTPVYPRRFFLGMFQRFSRECLLVVIRQAGKPVAGGFLVMAGRRAEIPWAACRREFKTSGFNMRLYWEVLLVALNRGCDSMDFGRSTVGSGTFRFKQQWGARPVQLYWHRWDRNSGGTTSADQGRHGRLMNVAASVWQRLPLTVTNLVGPLISPSLPW